MFSPSVCIVRRKTVREIKLIGSELCHFFLEIPIRTECKLWEVGRSFDKGSLLVVVYSGPDHYRWGILHLERIIADFFSPFRFAGMPVSRQPFFSQSILLTRNICFDII
ncbi:hypothetical protein AVEN_28875-1 [Araneus ventricosus]|uniref:Uncharacterized protein n=1 Tax=Araneus ventricosus TaxID=182803 RepID=A0A4Y2AJJ6_ARAVE|nr:hypothetical protein AVEN_28875-1 [Araneus ventricosus]